MPIISQIGRKAPKTRLLIATIYLVLIVGAATMVYPFLLMISGSFKGSVDRQQWDVVPRFLYDGAMLFRKFAEAKYNETLSDLNTAYKTRHFGFDKLSSPKGINAKAVADWKAFLASKPLPVDYQVLGYVYGFRVSPRNARLLTAHMQSKTDADLVRFNAKYGTTCERWDDIVSVRSGVWVERWMDRHYQPVAEPLGPLYREFRATRPESDFYPVSLDGDFLERQIYPHFGKFKIELVNQAYGTKFASFSEICLPARRPSNPAFAKDWEQYVRMLLHPRFIRMEASARPAYESFVRTKYATIDAFNSIHGTRYSNWADIPVPSEAREEGVSMADCMQFIESSAPAESITIVGPEFQFREFLRAGYKGDLVSLRTAHGINYASFDAVPIPAMDYDLLTLSEHGSDVRKEFLVRNYAIVLDYLVLHGRALWNTIIFCALAILTALIVNPLAAYALSRYQLPSQYKILFFLMATMAFPAEVTIIPGFLLLKQLDMLNTFWALILPGAANGYAIFLLKGFFDSLPRELYESAQIDGASEWRMFWGITMTLSTPILAVIALSAFTGAYGAFLFALLTCQSEKMWTIMVYLYQLQQTYSQPVVFASLLVAAVPTLLVFVFCQNIIMRGIVVPVEK